MPAVNAVVRALSGVRVFERDELTGALADMGLIDVEQRVTGLAQFVSCSRPRWPASQSSAILDWL
jgi:hypothetical protein